MNKAQAVLCCLVFAPALALAQEAEDGAKAASSAEQAESANAVQEEAMQESQDEAMEPQEASEEVTEIPAEMLIGQQSEGQIRSDQLVGSAVVNASDEKIGTVDDLLMSQQGQLVGIIVGVGGFLGINEKHVALDWGAVELTENEQGLQVRTTVEKAALEEAEAFQTAEAQQREAEMEQQPQEQQQMQQKMEEEQTQMQQEPKPEEGEQQ